MQLTAITLLLVVHFIADFVLQSRWMGTQKSKNWRAMAAHISVYTLCLFGFGLFFAFLNGVLHWITDSISSRLTTKYYLSNSMHKFWIVIGADQLVHVLCLLWTFELLQS